MNKGAAILDFGNEDYGVTSQAPFSKGGPDLSDNNLSSNKVTLYNKVGEVSDAISHDIKGKGNKGVNMTQDYGTDNFN